MPDKIILSQFSKEEIAEEIIKQLMPLLQSQSAAHPTGEDAKFLSRADVCEMLCMSRTKLWDLTRKGEIQGRRIGRSVRYLYQDVITYIEKSKMRSPK